MPALSEFTLLIGVAQVVALAAIFVRLGRVFERADTNRAWLNDVRENLAELKDRVAELEG